MEKEKDLINELKEKEVQQNEKKRFVDLSGLPTLADSGKAGKGIDWKSVNGIKAPFVYDDISGYIEFGEYDVSRSAILCKYKDNESYTKVNKLKSGGIASVLGKINRGFRYEVGQIIKSKTTGSRIEILSREMKPYGNKGARRKTYTYKCLKDGYIGEILEYMIEDGCGCSICGNYGFSEEINSVKAKYDYLVEYFVNKEDSERLSPSSNEKVLLKCPNCNDERYMSVKQLVEHGFSCYKCSDGISYPNRFVYNVIRSVYDGEIFAEKKFEWSGGKRYDIYIPEFNLISEQMGLQHYKYGFKKLGRTLEEEQENDKYKYKLAIDNGITNYITIDCRQSNMNHIKKSIIESGILEIIGVRKDDVDWNECHKKACTSNVIEVCKLWNSGLSISEISDKIKIHKCTVYVYLKKGNDANICSYTNEEARKRGNSYSVKKSGRHKIKILKNGISLGEYNSAREIERISLETFGVKLLYRSISKVCTGKMLNYKGYTFEYVNSKKESA